MDKKAHVFSGIVSSATSVIMGTTSVATAIEAMNKWNDFDQRQKFGVAVGITAFGVGSIMFATYAASEFSKVVNDSVDEIKSLENKIDGISEEAESKQREARAEIFNQIREYARVNAEIKEAAEKNNPDPEACETEEPNHHVIRPPKSRGFFGFKK